MTLQRLQGDHPAIPKLNALVDALNGLRGDGMFISVSPSGMISLNWQGVVQRMPRFLRNPSELSYAKIVAIKDSTGAAWTAFSTAVGYQAYCTANPCDSAGANVDTGTTLYIELTPDAVNAYQGYERWAATDIIAYHRADGQSTAPGSGSPLKPYDGLAAFAPHKLGMLRGHA